MPLCFFVSDLHGKLDRYKKLFTLIEDEKPEVVFFGGDLLPSGIHDFTSGISAPRDFFQDILVSGFLKLQNKLGADYPAVLMILGNDDGKGIEAQFIEFASKGLWKYIHNKRFEFKEFSIYGYSYIPPTPFLLKDWEKYDVSRYVDPGCVSPEEGYHSFQVNMDEIIYSTIQEDLEKLVGHDDLSKSIFLFHTPPYQTNLDRAALDGKMFEHVPLDVHVGSIAVKRFIEEKGPLITLHGHVHESTRLTGNWKDEIGKTIAFSAAHDASELALVRFDPEEIHKSSRTLV